jgi:hypothetical protein
VTVTSGGVTPAEERTSRSCQSRTVAPEPYRRASSAGFSSTRWAHPRRHTIGAHRPRCPSSWPTGFGLEPVAAPFPSQHSHAGAIRWAVASIWIGRGGWRWVELGEYGFQGADTRRQRVAIVLDGAGQRRTKASFSSSDRSSVIIPRIWCYDRPLTNPYRRPDGCSLRFRDHFRCGINLGCPKLGRDAS